MTAGYWVVTDANGTITLETPNRTEAEDTLTNGDTLTWENSE